MSKLTICITCDISRSDYRDRCPLFSRKENGETSGRTAGTDGSYQAEHVHAGYR